MQKAGKPQTEAVAQQYCALDLVVNEKLIQIRR
jgi:hypothetical protein